MGQKTTATCLISSGKSTPIIFTWLRNGKEITESQEIRVKNGKDFSLIIVDPVKVESGGNYTCMASDDHTKTLFTTHLSIEAPPSWQVEPEDSYAIYGDSAQLHCSAVGSPEPKISWKKVKGKILAILSCFLFIKCKIYYDFMFIDASIDLHTRKNGDVLQNGTLLIKNVTHTDSGVYECVADNGVKPELRKTIALIINGKIDDIINGSFNKRRNLLSC